MPDLDGYDPQKMVHWYNPPVSVRTGLESLLGVLFGPFNDRREVQAALDPSIRAFPYDNAQNDTEFWFDFVADLGDGWNSTYAIASLLAQDSIKLDHHGYPLDLPRGRFLVMGGDQVYPIAKEKEYRLRVEQPYRFAFPSPPPALKPDLFAIPGNHDWYDGLTSFLRVFCQRLPIGEWQTHQLRSYFALRLPYGWWLWGIDTQLQADLDRPQREYFEKVAKGAYTVAGNAGEDLVGGPGLVDGDRIILCVHQPGWLYSNHDTPRHGGQQWRVGPHDILTYIEQEIIHKNHAVLALTLAGDWHHYCRYVNVPGTTHKITSGGGGAYLRGTDTLENAVPVLVPVLERCQPATYLKTTVYPSENTSEWLVYRNLIFAWFNPLFSMAFLGAFYLSHSWMVQGKNLPGAVLLPGAAPGRVTFLERMLQIPTSDWNLFQHGWLPELPKALGSILHTYYVAVSGTPAILLFPVFLWLCLALFCRPSEYVYRWKDRSRWAIGIQKGVVGGLHAGAHIVLNLVLIWLFVNLNLVWLRSWSAALKNWLAWIAAWWKGVIAWLGLWSHWLFEFLPDWIGTVNSWLTEIFHFLFGWIWALLSIPIRWILNAAAWMFTYDPFLHSWWQRLLYGTEMIVVGGLAAGTVFGLYLVISNRLLEFHEDSAFSSLRIEDYKNFLRLCLTPEGLTVFPIGLRKVPRCWRKLSKGPSFEPVDRKIEPHLIEDPINIDVAKVAQANPTIGVGLTFREQMSGWFSMGETDPVEGARKGRIQRSELIMNLTIVIDSLDRFLCENDHTALLRAHISFQYRPMEYALEDNLRRQFSWSPGTGRVKLFAPYGNTPRKSIEYEMPFPNGVCRIWGEKKMEDDPGFDIWKDTTTLYTRLECQIDGNWEVLGAGILHVKPWKLIKNLFSFRPFNFRSFLECYQSIAVFLLFFISELWEIYVSRTKGFLVKYAVVSCVTLGGFYLVHAWSIEAASGMTFMSSIVNSDWSPWYWPDALKTTLSAYLVVYLQAPAILIFPFFLIIALALCRRDNGRPTWLGLGNLQFCPGWFTRVRGVIHALAQIVLNLVLIWACVKINHGLPLDSFHERLLFFIEMVLFGGIAAGLLYSLFRDVKLVRPYAG